MESSQAEVILTFLVRVITVDRKRRLMRSWKVGDEVMTQHEDLGWFIHLEGSHESIYVGHTKPKLHIGDLCKVTIQGPINAQPSQPPK